MATQFTDRREILITSKTPDRSTNPALTSVDSSSQTQGPVFIISSFRTSSTWLWNKMRQAPSVVAYYECFHEYHSLLTVEQVKAQTTDVWNSHHPSTAPYFLEYLPLLKKEGGVRLFEPRMTFESFIPSTGITGSLDAEEIQYIESLIRNAIDQRKIPLLTCCRILGRSAALRKCFPGRYIFLHRNLYHQWASYTQNAIGGNIYFLDTINRILKFSKHDPIMNLVDEWCADRETRPDNEMFFLAFLLVHLYFSAHAFDAADIVLDSTAMATNTTLRCHAENQLSEIANWPIDLSDCRNNFELSIVKIRSIQNISEIVDQFIKIFEPVFSERAISFVRDMKADAFEELERHQFYIGRGVVHHDSRIKELEDRLAGEINIGKSSIVELETRLGQERETELAETLQTFRMRETEFAAALGKANSERDAAVAANDARDHTIALLTKLAQEHEAELTENLRASRLQETEFAAALGKANSERDAAIAAALKIERMHDQSKAKIEADMEITMETTLELREREWKSIFSEIEEKSWSQNSALGSIRDRQIAACILNMRSHSITPPSGYFDETSYLSANADVEVAVLRKQFENGLEHWLQFGLIEGRPGFFLEIDGDELQELVARAFKR